MQWSRSGGNQGAGGDPAERQRPSQPFELPILPDYSRSDPHAAESAVPRQPVAARNLTGAPSLAGTLLSGDGLLSRATATLPAVSSSPSASSSRSSQPPAEIPGPMPARVPTLTARMHAIQPPDVARQAVSELGVLSRELATLPDNLEAAGLIRTHQSSYFEAVRGYLGLARQAWQSVAEERLEQSGADPEYRQRAILVARRITQLQQECRTAQDNDQFKLPQHSVPLWRRRVALVRTGLRVWQNCLAPTPDPRAMGRGLFLLRGYLGLATAGSIDLLLLELLQWAAVAGLACLSVGVALLMVAAILAGNTTAVTSAGIGAFALAVSGTLLFFTLRGAVPLSLLLGASVFSPTRSTRNEHPGSPILAGVLRAWWLAIGVLGAFAIVGGLVVGGFLINMPGVLAPFTDARQGLSMVGNVAAYVAALPATAALASLGLLGLPVLVLTVVRFTQDFAGGSSWVPMARRFGLELALMAHAAFVVTLIVGLWLGVSALGLQQVTLVGVSFGEIGGISTAITPRAIVLFLLLALLYPLQIDLPFRIGMTRWRRAWLADLDGRRADVESHVRRLSVTDPRTGTQDTSEENLRAMQYDLVLLQFYRAKMEEAEHTANAPFRVGALVAALAILAVTAVLLDAGATLLTHLLGLF